VSVINTGSNKGVREEGVLNVTNARALLKALLLGDGFKLVHVHVSNAEDYGKLAPVGLAAALRGFPWMATIHSGNSGVRLRSAPFLRRAATGALLAGARKIVCVNAAIQQAMTEVVRSGTAIEIPPFSVDYAECRLPADVDEFLTTHAPVLACVGLYEPLYGFDHAIRALAVIRDAYPRAGLLLIGDLRGAEPFRQLIGDLHVEHGVKLCGNLGHQECLTVLRRCALLVRPTLYDGDSLTVREALALGLPVVASTTDFRPPGVRLFKLGALADLVGAVRTTLADGSDIRPRSVDDCQNLEQVRQIYLGLMRN
jgi:glycosyltransferase involved in cell wall biosynthesis